MDLIYLKPRDLTNDETQAFWQQDVCMDDWDYMLLAPPDAIEEREEEGDVYDYGLQRYEPATVTKLVPTDYTLERLLIGVCSNEWYRATFRGKPYAVGVAYHA